MASSTMALCGVAACHWQGVGWGFKYSLQQLLQLTLPGMLDGSKGSEVGRPYRTCNIGPIGCKGPISAPENQLLQWRSN